MKTYICIVCGFIYDETSGRPEDGLALVVAPRAPGASGTWHAVEAGVWQYKDASDAVRGFVLAGGAITRWAEQSRLVQTP